MQAHAHCQDCGQVFGNIKFADGDIESQYFMKDCLLAFRIEWEGHGPFWCEKTLRLMKRLCRQATPEWKNREDLESSFLERYIARAACPYDTPAFDHILSRISPGDNRYAFGFLSKQVMQDALGLSADLQYLRQFEAMFLRPEFRVRVYGVAAMGVSATEVIFRRQEAQLLDEALSFEQFQTL